MQAQMETAAQAYRRRKKEGVVTEEVYCSTCQEKWKVRKAPLDFWVASGMIPSGLAAVMMERVKQKQMSETDVIASLDLHQLTQSIEFTSKMVRYTAVEPRIVETPTEPTDLGYDEVDMCCYNFLRDWQMKGGGRAATLETFRSE